MCVCVCVCLCLCVCVRVLVRVRVREHCRELLLKMEEEYIANMCRQIAALKPDVVITEKGLSDLAAHYLAR